MPKPENITFLLTEYTYFFKIIFFEYMVIVTTVIGMYVCVCQFPLLIELNKL